jgi:hypothetical protein
MAQLNQETFPALNPEILMRNWQQSGMRMLRAQERMLTGIVNATRLEIQFGQDMLSRRAGLLKRDTTNPTQNTDYAVEEMKHFFTVFREVSEELQRGFADATKLLAEGAEPAIQEVVHKGLKMQEDFAHKSTDMMDDTLKTTTTAAKSMAAKTGDAMTKVKETSPGYGGAAGKA